MSLRKLKALRRRQLVEDARREKVRLQRVSDRAMRASIGRVLRLLQHEIAQLEAAIKRHIASSKTLRERARLLRSAPGVGPDSVSALLADLPELGSLSSRQVAALAGLAPMARDSGLRRGRRRIGGGRKALRDTLYMAGMSAAR